VVPLSETASKFGISLSSLSFYGDQAAKLRLPPPSFKPDKQKNLIVVTSITPTPLGEGKTVTTLGLAQALNLLGKKACASIRQPSMAPVFGVKGGGGGGGRAKILPYEDFNLHFTGDNHAVESAHNLCAAFLDNSLMRKNPPGIKIITWKRAIDIADRSLREIRGAHGKTGFEITAASEIMAILSLSRSFEDLRRRISRIVIGEDRRGRPVTPEHIRAAGAMTALLATSLRPNLTQTCENTPVLAHTGPFANIAHGNSSVLADLIALKYFDYVVTESGFGADCGLEKFMHIKCRISGLRPAAAVLVVTVRALKLHAGTITVEPGHPLPKELFSENIAMLEKGLPHLKKQIENVTIYGLPCVVAVNRFPSDTDRELELIEKKAFEFGAREACVSDIYEKGGRGGKELARKVAGLCSERRKIRFLYDPGLPLEEKIRIVALKIYGAGDVSFMNGTREQLKKIERWGYSRFPVCMAKTQFSLSHDPKWKGVPSDYTLPVTGMRIAAGAGFAVPFCGKINTLPGLPLHPLGEHIDLDKTGKIRGLK